MILLGQILTAAVLELRPVTLHSTILCQIKATPDGITELHHGIDTSEVRLLQALEGCHNILTLHHRCSSVAAAEVIKFFTLLLILCQHFFQHVSCCSIVTGRLCKAHKRYIRSILLCYLCNLSIVRRDHYLIKQTRCFCSLNGISQHGLPQEWLYILSWNPLTAATGWYYTQIFHCFFALIIKLGDCPNTNESEGISVSLTKAPAPIVTLSPIWQSPIMALFIHIRQFFPITG